LRAAFSKSECSPYGGAYVAALGLSNVVSKATIDVTAEIDTGFSGSVMVDSDAYSGLFLEMTQRPEAQFPSYRTLAGPILFKSSPARAKIGEKELNVEVISPVAGKGKNLIGRGLLREFTTILHREEMACIGDAKVED
jgi:clan AA aspartic protease